MFGTNLKQKQIIIIGGSSGMGLATAKMAFELGAHVTLTRRTAEKAQKAATEINPAVQWATLDVDDEAQVLQFFNNISAADHIYIAAGSTTLGSVTDGVLAEKLKGFETRLVGSLRVVRAAISKMNPGGSFTFTGGVSTDRPITGAWISGLGTAAAEQLARVLVMEFPGVRFNAVSPGYTDTPMWDGIMGENKTEILAGVAEKLPVKKIATAEEVAAAVLFLMANESVTGEILHVDGGARLI